MEFPTDFFLNFARDPQRWPKDKLGEFTRLWAEREFGAPHAAEIADMVSTYLKYNGRRKPELLDPWTFSITDYQEADRVVADFHSLIARAEKLQSELPENARDAFFELVLHPAKSYAQVAELYIATAKNRLYAAQGRASANDYAAQVKALFQADIDLGNYYNHTLANGKWDHMMDQTHIGYTYWQEPPRNVMPEVKEIELPDAPAMGISVEGGPGLPPAPPPAFPGGRGFPAGRGRGAPGAAPPPPPPPAPVTTNLPTTLPDFDVFNQQRRYIDIFNKGKGSFDFTASSSAPWIALSAAKGTVDKEQRLWVSIDWSKAPKGTAEGSVKINDVAVSLKAVNPREVTRANLKGFVEANGAVSMEAEHFTRKFDTPAVKWEKIDDYGKTLSGMSLFPVTAESITPPQKSPCLEYEMYLFSSGKAEVDAILSPSLNFVPGRGLRYAVSFDDQPPQIVDATSPIAGNDNLPRDWESSVKDSVRHVKTALSIAAPGYHTLKFWMVDPAVVVEKLVVDMGGVKPSYLGPPESYNPAIRK
jgi:hypothetical protein